MNRTNDVYTVRLTVTHSYVYPGMLARTFVLLVLRTPRTPCSEKLSYHVLISVPLEYGALGTPYSSYPVLRKITVLRANFRTLGVRCSWYSVLLVPRTQKSLVSAKAHKSWTDRSLPRDRLL